MCARVLVLSMSYIWRGLALRYAPVALGSGMRYKYLFTPEKGRNDNTS